MIETEVSTIVAIPDRARGSLRWLVTALRGHSRDLTSDLCFVDLPPEDSSGDCQRLMLVPPGVDGPPPLALDHPWLQRLLQLAQEQGPLEARACQQPQQWQELEGQLLGAYVVAGGEKCVASCTLDEQPVLQLTVARYGESGLLEFETIHCDESGRILGEELVSQLRLDDIEVQQQPTIRRLTHEWVVDWVSRSADQLDGAAPGFQLIAATVIWCKFAEGKIALTLNGRRADVHFQGWAQLLSTGALRPPPFTCPATGISSYQVTATDDGVLTAIEAIGVCEHTGARVLCKDLRTCADTGAQVVGRLLEVCPITNQPAVPCAFEQCQCCRQRVRKIVIESDVCLACRSLQPVHKNDPRLARLLGQYPRLDRWRDWQLSETGTYYVLVAQSLFKRLLLVVEKSNLAPLRTALSRRWRRRPWLDVDDDEQSHILGEA